MLDHGNGIDRSEPYGLGSDRAETERQFGGLAGPGLDVDQSDIARFEVGDRSVDRVPGIHASRFGGDQRLDGVERGSRVALAAEADETAISGLLREQPGDGAFDAGAQRD